MRAMWANLKLWLEDCRNVWINHAIGHYGDILVIKHSKRHDSNRVYNEPNYIIA